MNTWLEVLFGDGEGEDEERSEEVVIQVGSGWRPAVSSNIATASKNSFDSLLSFIDLNSPIWSDERFPELA